MNRRAADLGARADHAAPAPVWLTTDAPAVRVGGGGGGRPRRACRRRPGSHLRRACGAERCLSQRRELECRSHGTAHQLAERALVRSAGRQLGEHVFEKVGAGSDGTGPDLRHDLVRFGSGSRKMRRRSATCLAEPAGRARAHPAQCGGAGAIVPSAVPRGGRDRARAVSRGGRDRAPRSAAGRARSSPAQSLHIRAGGRARVARPVPVPEVKP
jgi:hypothetical protein